ncbi:MAG: HDOD domain-containing protein [Chitinivibrionales bacterium]|nr:HDOD domain-containing protein [Chitinivibrionales bacterium]
MDIRKSILEKLKGCQDLPVLNSDIMELNKKLTGTEANTIDYSDIAAIIEKDIGLSAKVLKIANSSYYCSRFGKIESIKHAVSRLGMNHLSRIVLAFSSMATFKQNFGSINLAEFWRHSLSVAVVTRDIIKKSKKSNLNEDNAYIAGLFHDVGILLLSKYFSAQYTKVLETVQKSQDPIQKVEKQELGIEHGEISAFLMSGWKLPQPIIDAVNNHHCPGRSPQPSYLLTQILYLSDFSCSSLGVCEPGRGQVDEGSFVVWDDLGLGIDDMQTIIDQTLSGISLSGEFVEIGM